VRRERAPRIGKSAHSPKMRGKPPPSGCLQAREEVRPFNGEHNAGVQVLNTVGFPDLQGPLLNLKP
jgi:hypothetical protein